MKRCTGKNPKYDMSLPVPAKRSQTGKRPTNNISIEHFTIERVIGRGAFGKVFMVKKKDTKEIYAMKVLKKD